MSCHGKNLIYMQSQNINRLQFILNYRDHFTTFVSLKALKSKHTEWIEHNFLDIYTIFGALATPHSNDDREFVTSITS